MKKTTETHLSAYSRLLKSSTNYILYGFLHFFFSGLGQTFLIGSFKSYFVRDVSWWDGSSMTNTHFSWIYMSCTLLSGFMILVFGPVVDRFKLRNVSLLAATSMIIFTILLSRTTSIEWFIIGLFGVRFCGQGVLPLIGSTGIARYFEKDRGKALSLSTMGISISETILAPLVGALLLIWDWQNVWQLLGAMVCLIFIPAVIFLVSNNDSFQKPVGDRTKKAKLSKGRIYLLGDLKFYLLLGAYVFPPFFFTGVFVNTELVEELQGYESLWLLFCLPAYGITRALTTLYIGPIIDNYTAVKVFPISMLPLFLGCLALVIFQHPFYVIIFTALAGMTTSISGTCASAMWAEIYGTKHLGAIKSLTTTFMIFATSLSVPLFNWSLSYFDKLSYTFIPCLTVIAILTIAVWFNNRTLSRNTISV